MKDPYKTLGVSSDASADEIKKAYFALAKKYHPDTGSDENKEKFFEVSEAYQILSDNEQKKAYDLTRDSGQIKEPLVDEVIHKQTDIDVDPEQAYRQKEMHAFRRGLLYKAYARVAFYSLLLAAAGYFYALLFEGTPVYGLILGMILGFVWSVYRNFDVDSFVFSAKAKKQLKTAHYLVIGVSLAYFVVILFV